MACDEARIIAFLSGDLTPVERAAMDAHLLACDACWRAVQEDRLGRRAVELLAEPAPPDLAERIGFAVELADRAPATEVADRAPATEVADGIAVAARRPRRAVLAAVAATVTAAGLGVGLGLAGSTPGDPPTVAALVSMAGSSRPPAPPRVERVRLAQRPVVLHVDRYHGVVAFVAVSSRPFPMPPAAHVVAGSSARAWMAARGTVGLYCLNAPSGSHSMLVAATMPAVELPGVLVGLHLG